ncbi:hypothetical protein RvY_07117 [Ramazzottius varieornatus]|uniref:Uncharacterized protein n=1 Tax=Ramazzottius varieornatus TaxID=947166 RepID=A0A1D1V9K5_RAMVA|nr:hypothetical protein RvY_07117 [Ramazzottius varieornatus]
MDNDSRHESLVKSFIYPMGTLTKPEVNLSRAFQLAGNENHEHLPPDSSSQRIQNKDLTFKDLPVPVFHRRGSILVPGGVQSAEYISRSTTMEEGRPQADQGRRLRDYFSALAPSNWFGPKQN